MDLGENTLLIGADPELFLRSKGRLLCAGNFITGTKEEPYRMEEWPGAIQVDGMAAEFNIDPANNEEQFVGNINSMLDHLKKRANRWSNYTEEVELVAEPVANFGYEMLSKQPEQYRELGCNPDWNAWDKELNASPDASFPFRTGSGHIHIGWTDGATFYEDEYMEECFKIVRHLDYYLGIHSLLWDPDPTRRMLYGRAGAFRPKHYGLEYRVMSNAWLRSPDLMRWVFRTTNIAMDAYRKGDRPEEKYGNLARQIIDNNETSWFDNYGDIVGITLPPTVDPS